MIYSFGMNWWRSAFSLKAEVASACRYMLINFYCSVATVWRLAPSRRITRVARYLLRCLWHPAPSLSWATELALQPALRDWFAHNPRLLLKPSRHYLSKKYGFTDRIGVLCNHYAQIETLLSAHSIGQLAAGESVLLAEILGKRGGCYQLVLARTDKWDREGELALSLQDALLDRFVYCVVFSLNCVHGEACIEIGCIQGSKAEDARDEIRRATKDCHGIRPRDLLLEALCALARAWRLRKLFGISNRARIYDSASNFSDYDAVWAEMGGGLVRDGFFQLPARIHHRDLSSVPSHHRSEYRKRMALRHGIAEQVRASLAVL